MQKYLQNNRKIIISTISIRTFRESINAFNAGNICRRFVRCCGELLEGLIRNQTARGGCSQLCACDFKRNRNTENQKETALLATPHTGCFISCIWFHNIFSFCSFLKLKLGVNVSDQLHWCHHPALIHAVQCRRLSECLQSYSIIKVKCRISLVMNMTRNYLKF